MHFDLLILPHPDAYHVRVVNTPMAMGRFTELTLFMKRNPMPEPLTFVIGGYTLDKVIGLRRPAENQAIYLLL